MSDEVKALREEFVEVYNELMRHRKFLDSLRDDVNDLKKRLPEKQRVPAEESVRIKDTAKEVGT